MAHRAPSRSAGFTLIELLTVLLILSILAVALLFSARDALGTAKIEIAGQQLAQLEVAIKSYQNENGAPPPSSFVPAQEVANDGTNVGIEALVVTLWSKKYEGGGLSDDLRDKLINSDNDRSTKQLTDFATRDLLEIPDPWGNPVAYIEKSDYPLTNRRYLTTDAETGEQVDSVPLAFKNTATGQYYAAGGFQLISAGPDGRFGTEDDVTTFKRE